MNHAQENLELIAHKLKTRIKELTQDIHDYSDEWNDERIKIYKSVITELEAQYDFVCGCL